jgi:hypothetical protein
LLFPLLFHFETGCGGATLVAGESLIQNGGATMVYPFVTNLFLHLSKV